MDNNFGPATHPNAAEYRLQEGGDQRQYLADQALIDDLPASFHEALDESIRRFQAQGGSFAGVLSRLGLSTHTAYSWRNGKATPRVVSCPSVRGLEEELGVPSGSLTGRLGFRLRIPDEDIPEDFHAALDMLAKNWRAITGLGFSDLATSCGTDTERLYKWRSGQGKPGIKALPIISSLEEALDSPHGTLLKRLGFKVDDGLDHLPDDFGKALTELIDRYRIATGNSQRDLCEAIGTFDAVLLRWRKGLKPGVQSIPMLTDLEKALNVPLGTLVGRLGYEITRANDYLPDSFSGALNALAIRYKSTGKSLQPLAASLGIMESTLYSWRYGKAVPSAAKYSTVCNLEALLGAPAGTLVDRLDLESNEASSWSHTFRDLRKRYLLSKGGVSARKIPAVKNRLTALKRFMESFEASKSDNAVVLLGPGFKDRLENHLEMLRNAGRAHQTVKDRASHLNFWHDLYRDTVIGDGLPESFSEALRALLIKRSREGVTQEEIGRRVGVSPATFGGWCKGVAASLRSRPKIAVLEKELGVQEGTLEMRLPKRQAKKKVAEKKRGLATPYRKKARGLRDYPYGLRHFPPTLEKEWSDLKKYKTAAFLPPGIERNTSWSSVDLSRAAPSSIELERGILDDGKYSASAAISGQNLQRFFGYLILPNDCSEPKLCGEGLAKEDLTLSLFSRFDVIHRFLEFKRLRSGGYNTDTENFLGFAAMLLAKDVGFLWQHPEYGQKLSPSLSPDEWRSACEECHKEIRRFEKSLKKGNHVKQTRDPKDPLQGILARTHPMEALLELIEGMENSRPSEKRAPIKLALHMRDELVVKMITANPLRIKMFSIMTWRENGSGNLYQNKETGEWRLRFSPSDFKNEHGAAKDPYDMGLPERLWPDIEDYLKNHRPNLAGADICDYVFRPALNANSEKNKAAPIIPKRLSLKIDEWSAAILPDCPGFGPHGVRHIIATDYLKNNPNGYQVVAHILHDKLETVLKNYAHLQVADGFRFFSAYQNGVIDNYNKKSEAA
ncbi:hypothetical protein [Zhongshania marina]|nr:hypothetical protein [Marortus luteolus]